MPSPSSGPRPIPSTICACSFFVCCMLMCGDLQCISLNVINLSDENFHIVPTTRILQVESFSFYVTLWSLLVLGRKIGNIAMEFHFPESIYFPSVSLEVPWVSLKCSWGSKTSGWKLSSNLFNHPNFDMLQAQPNQLQKQAHTQYIYRENIYVFSVCRSIKNTTSIGNC